MDAPDRTRAFAKQLRRELTLPEGLLWRAIKARKIDRLQFRRQHPIGPYVLDFYCAARKLAVEVDGASHSMGDAPERDERRGAWLAEQGVRVLRIRAAVVLEDVDNAVEMVRSAAAGDDFEF